tara:strand:- start:1227 stop:1415 length:189 start_codon:yes stop_codon:yes gene_type:complete
MTNDVILTQAAHDQLVSLIEQLIEVSIWQDAEAKAKDPIANTGESFMTNKLKLIRDTLKNGS